VTAPHLNRVGLCASRRFSDWPIVSRRQPFSTAEHVYFNKFGAEIWRDRRAQLISTSRAIM
jgi:hypothetical protein